MIDKDFELAAELLTNEGYFRRYREHRAGGKNCREAWAAVEAEIPLGLRRFRNHTAFKDALLKERRGILPVLPRLTYSPE
jgi:hypothetical protein